MILTRASTALFFTCLLLTSQAFSGSSDEDLSSEDRNEQHRPSFPRSSAEEEEDSEEEFLSNEELRRAYTAVDMERSAIPDTAPYPTSKSLLGKFLRGCFYVTGCCGDNANHATQTEKNAISTRIALHRQRELTPPAYLEEKRTALQGKTIAADKRKNLRKDRLYRLYFFYIAFEVAKEVSVLSLLYQADILSCEERAAIGITECTDTAQNLLTASKLLMWGHVATNIAAAGLPLRYFWNGVSGLTYNTSSNNLSWEEKRKITDNYHRFMTATRGPFIAKVPLELSYLVLSLIMGLDYRGDIRDSAYTNNASIINSMTQNLNFWSLYMGSKCVADVACGIK